MKITIRKEHLMQQLPKDVRYSLLSFMDDMPETFEFDGIPVPPDDENSLIVSEAKVYSILTHTQWEFFKELKRHPQGIHTFSLAKHMRTGRTMKAEYLNSLAVHVYTMRKKFEKHKIPYEITYSRTGGRYNLISKNV